MTREDCIVITGYGFMAAVSAGIAFRKLSIFFMVGFFLAYILKIAVSMLEGHTHSHGLEAAPTPPVKE